LVYRDADPMPSREPVVPILYIAGSGRSGSTLLDVILDNHPAVTGVGELMNLVPGAYLDGRYCACGQPASACPFWAEVRDAWTRRRTGLDFAAYAALQRKFERHAAWPRVMLERRRRSGAFLVYADWTVALYQAIREVSGRPWVVDSSKVPTRAAALALIPGLDLRVLHLVRDGRAVADSLQKPFHKDIRAGLPRDVSPAPVWRTAAFWMLVNLQAAALRRLLATSHSLRVRYEDLTADFPAAAGRVGRVMDLDLGNLARRVAEGDELRPRHTVEGNRLRMLPGVRVRADVEWMARLPRRDRAIFWVMAGWLLRAYGYGKDGSAVAAADRTGGPAHG
jgi:hypothetical protein